MSDCGISERAYQESRKRIGELKQELTQLRAENACLTKTLERASEDAEARDGENERLQAIADAALAKDEIGEREKMIDQLKQRAEFLRALLLLWANCTGAEIDEMVKRKFESVDEEEK